MWQINCQVHLLSAFIQTLQLRQTTVWVPGGLGGIVAAGGTWLSGAAGYEMGPVLAASITVLSGDRGTVSSVTTGGRSLLAPWYTVLCRSCWYNVTCWKCGLKIPVEVEVQMENSSENQQALSKYQTLVAENYHEPVIGKYVDATPDILEALYCEDELTDFEDEGDEEVDTNTADLDSVVLETDSGSVPLGSVDVITID
ncbi:hypothetical protein ACROYT_G019397 [Oculina patagonica]